MTIAEVQKLIWLDLIMFQSFISKEIAKAAGSDNLQIYPP
jgi:hypothetical protein